MEGVSAFIKKHIYWYRLWTGTYMLAWWEQILFNVLFMAITAPFFYYTVKTARPLFQFVKYQLICG